MFKNFFLVLNFVLLISKILFNTILNLILKKLKVIIVFF